MLIYRVEHTQNKNGLWYTEDGFYDGFVEKLEDQFLSTLPMGHDPNMIIGGIPWISGADSLEQMKLWVSKDALKDLLSAGFKMFEVYAENGRHVPNHVVYDRHSVISKVDRTDLFTSLWD